MAERIRQYLAYIDGLLAGDNKDIDYEQECKKHLVQIAFFAHERLIHLIVTVLFALMTLAVFLYTMSNPQPALFILLFFILCLMVPYIKHYYLLENSVQRMYEQYDAMLKRTGQKGFQVQEREK